MTPFDTRQLLDLVRGEPGCIADQVDLRERLFGPPDLMKPDFPEPRYVRGS